MKKAVSIFTLIVCMALLLFACASKQPEPEPELDPPIVEPPVVTDPRQTPEALAFYNEEKEPWGEKDLSLYTYDGQVLVTATGPSIYGEGIALYYPLNSSTPNIKAVTYRGIAPGDDAITALEHMQIPEETVRIRYTQNTEYTEPFSIDMFIENPNGNYNIYIFLDENFQVMNVSNGWVGASWSIQIHMFGGIIESYSAGNIEYTIPA